MCIRDSARFSCPNSHYGPPVKCTCKFDCPITDSILLSQISACLSTNPVDGLCSGLAKYGAMPDWDVSRVTSLSHAFKDYENFDGDISKWDTRKVTNMKGLFYNARSFNQPIGAWDTSAVTDMRYILYGSTAFKQSLHEWTGPAAKTMQDNMLYGATGFQARYLCSDILRGPLTSCQVRPTPSPLSDSTIYDAITACLSESPIHGECITYGLLTTNFGTMPNWDIEKVTDLSYAFKYEPVSVSYTHLTLPTKRIV